MLPHARLPSQPRTASAIHCWALCIPVRLWPVETRGKKLCPHCKPQRATPHSKDTLFGDTRHSGKKRLTTRSFERCWSWEYGADYSFGGPRPACLSTQRGARPISSLLTIRHLSLTFQRFLALSSDRRGRSNSRMTTAWFVRTNRDAVVDVT